MVHQLIQCYQWLKVTIMLKRFNFHILIAVGDGIFERPIATRTIQLANGEEVKIATVYDLMTSQYGVQRFEHELEATSYDDASSKYTPAWQEQITGIKKN